jgi:lipoprotein-anchoring transpeptidase ErfK/SrfK
MDPSPTSSADTGETPPTAGRDPASAGAPSGAGSTAAGPEAGAAVDLPAAGSTRAPRKIGPISIDRRSVAVAATIATLLATFAWAGTGYRYQPYIDEPAALPAKVPTGDKELKQLVSRLDRRSRDLAARLKAAAPRGVYIVIDQTQNRLYLKRDDDTLLEARCSAGSGMVLKESVGKKREWVFDSPRGRFEVLSMLRNPTWAKPDWAFVEEGQPIPTNPADRLETGSLGEYALYFGNGYMIHGTLYERLLGRAVSHGCIRVGRDDLRQVWANARIGMKIFIY